jgi:hypothetical protein
MNTKTPTKKNAEQTPSASSAPAVASNVSKSKHGLAMPIDVTKVMQEHKTKSAAIRYLSSLKGESGIGYTRSEIANALGIRYQHVRNVLTQPAKKSTVATPSVTVAEPVQAPKASEVKKAEKSKKAA